MKRLTHRLIGVGLLATAIAASNSAADARPPTVSVSPGYDARLAESRKAQAAQPVAPVPVRKKHKHRAPR